MKLTDYGLDAAEEKAAGAVRYWHGLRDVTINDRERLIVDAAAEAWTQVGRAVRASRAMRPATVEAAGEVASHQLHELEKLRGQDEGPVHTLGHAILAAEEACQLIAEILGQTEGEAP